MTAMLVGVIGNIILDPVCIYALHMGVAGAAIATLLARLISFSVYLFYLLTKRSNFNFSIKNFRFKKQIYIEIAKIGVPTFVYQFLCSAALSLTDIFAAKYGDAAVAAFGIVNRIMTLGVMTMFGFLRGYQPFIGFNYGAKKYERVKSATKYVLLWSTVFAGICCAAMILFRGQLICAFNSSDPQVQRIGSQAILFNAVTFLTMGIQTVYSFKFMGLGKAVEGGLISLGRQGIFFIPIIVLLSSVFGLVGVILAQPTADLLSFLLVVVLAQKNRNEEKLLLIKESVQ
jgi:putative MATE family efflux protein